MNEDSQAGRRDEKRTSKKAGKYGRQAGRKMSKKSDRKKRENDNDYRLQKCVNLHRYICEPV